MQRTTHIINEKNTVNLICFPKKHVHPKKKLIVRLAFISYGRKKMHCFFFPTTPSLWKFRGFARRALSLDELVGRSATETSALHFLELYLGRRRAAKSSVWMSGVGTLHMETIQNQPFMYRYI